MIHSLLNAFVGDHFRSNEIRPGAKYRRVEPTIMQTAQVLAVESDRAGHSHVHYIGHFEARNGNGAEYVDERRLSLATFQSSFTEVH